MSYALLISSRAARNGLGSPPAGHNDPRDLHSSRRPCMTSSPVFGPRDWEGVFAVKECARDVLLAIKRLYLAASLKVRLGVG